jgi:tRNA pseudouridine55 synthase
VTGVLLIDKPSGPTSHDVVARVRAVTGERSVGHTGTLDPTATGLLPLVLGKATRIASILSGGDKTYDAIIRLGSFTTTDDAEGTVTERYGGPLQDVEAVEAALARFVGEFDQIPPAHSAKKVGGEKAYDLARRDTPASLKPVTVTVRDLVCHSCAGDQVQVTLTASSGFYVRALARDLGRALGCGAHLQALRRTRVGSFDIANAVPLAEAERLGQDVARHLVAPEDALAELPAVTLTEAGLRRAVHGNSLSPEHLARVWVAPAGMSPAARVRVLGPDGRLVALADSRGGLLHPAVVLG